MDLWAYLIFIILSYLSKLMLHYAVTQSLPKFWWFHTTAPCTDTWDKYISQALIKYYGNPIHTFIFSIHTYCRIKLIILTCRVYNPDRKSEMGHRVGNRITQTVLTMTINCNNIFWGHMPLVSCVVTPLVIMLLYLHCCFRISPFTSLQQKCTLFQGNRDANI